MGGLKLLKKLKFLYQPRTGTFFFILLILGRVNLIAQDFVTIPRLISGPVQGYTTPSSVKIWLLVKDADVIRVELVKENEVHSRDANTDSCRAYDEYHPVTFEFAGLSAYTEYEVNVVLNNNTVRDKKLIRVRTLAIDSIPDYSFLLGSCAFMPSKFLRPFYPGPMDKIFSVMRKTPADFMLWLGDNLYYRPRHYGSVKGMYSQQVWMRKNNRIDNFMKSMPQYAVWDDHDYGSNDSDGSFPFKDSSLAVNKKFWPNPYFGTADIPGSFSSFRMYDSEFFLMDNRYYRTSPGQPEPAILGEQQLNWLLQGLKKSDAVFKFIAIGTQMVNESTPHECYASFNAEREKIFNHIKENRIEGVIFLTGDIHHTVLMKSGDICLYPIYDYTCSPLTSIVHNTHEYEYNNSKVVEGKVALVHNFGKIRIEGKEDDRKCIIETYDQRGYKLWEHVIHQRELKGSME